MMTEKNTEASRGTYPIVLSLACATVFKTGQWQMISLGNV